MFNIVTVLNLLTIILMVQFFSRFNPFSQSTLQSLAAILLAAVVGTHAPVQAVASASSLPQGFSQTAVASGLLQPVQLAAAPDGRIFVTEQAGKVRVIKNGVLLPTPFYTFSNVYNGGENGLHDFVFDPNFKVNNYVYAFYTTINPKTGRVVRLKANGDVAVPNSETVIFNMPDWGISTNVATIHNGGSLAFGADGKLYITTGEKNSAGNAQSMNTVLGKVLRINSDGSIPTDNPFFKTTDGNNKAIYALGLRNPFSLDVQPGTGKMVVDDTGFHTYEEIDVIQAGGNYGWPTAEGPSTNPNFINPLFSYRHSGDPAIPVSNCAITGGAFYNPTTVQFPQSYVGKYFFGDYCGDWIRTIDVNTGKTEQFLNGLNFFVDVIAGTDGSLYVLERGNGANTGSVTKISYNSAAPVITTQPADVSVQANSQATFTVQATGGSSLSYQWQKNGVDIPNATSATYSFTATAADNGAHFKCKVTNASGTTMSNEVTLTVIVGNPPAINFTSAPQTLYSAGDTVSYSATAVDPEDGDLPASAFSWVIVQYHDDSTDGSGKHTHPFQGPITGIKGGTFVIPTIMETSPNVWFRATLTVTDSDGQTTTAYQEFYLRKVNLTLDTFPSGLQLSIDSGAPFTTPKTIVGVPYVQRTLGAVSPQCFKGTNYVLTNWDTSNISTPTYAISFPKGDSTITATFINAGPCATGLTGNYFNNTSFSGAVLNRVDPNIDFTWSGSPMTGINADNFSVRWTGFIAPAISGNYTFYINTNDGGRLTINNQVVVDDMTAHWNREKSGQIYLDANQRYPIKLEYFDVSSTGVMQLSWSTSTMGKQIVPSSVLQPE